MSLLTLFQLNLKAAVGGPAKLVPIRQDWTSKPPLGTRLRTDGHWSTQGLVGAWALNEGGGGVVRDSSFSGLNGSISNTTWGANGLSFNGSSSFVNFGSVLSGLSQLSIVAGITPANLSTQQMVVSRGSGGIIDWYLYLTSSGKVGFATYNGTNYGTVGSLSLPLNAPSVIAGTVVGEVWSVFTNGVLGASTSTTSGPLGGSGSLVELGYAPGYGQYLTGSINFVLIYATALSPQQIASLSANPWQTFEPKINWVVIPGSGGSTFPVSYFDFGRALDICSCNVLAALSLGESGVAADIQSQIDTLLSTVAETGSGADTQSETAGIGETVTESGNAADIGLVAGQGFFLTETGMAADSFSGSMTAAVSIIELGQGIDNSTTASIYGVVISELGSGADIQSISMSVSLSLVESGQAADSEAPGLSASLTVSEKGNSQDIVFQGTVYSLAVGESGAAIDKETAGITAYLSIAESGAAIDAESIFAQFTAVVKESGAANDSIVNSPPIVALTLTEYGNSLDLSTAYIQPIFQAIQRILAVLMENHVYPVPPESRTLAIPAENRILTILADE